ncbi:2-aminoethylphosphonate--pyruvate transaminase [Octopus sinensis]|uniref:Alanine--glyoxylate aminotransferase n=1 Tax=Octopus sinensis TaxID=2607531 RepID=A0A6P7SXK1_9MOLL|nr:2-aminoethylphosphonate--pyruvate transaminase [Octopus sinensis]
MQCRFFRPVSLFRLIQTFSPHSFTSLRISAPGSTLQRVNYQSTEVEKKLFTPGPLCTTSTVREAMLKDLGSRDIQFIQCVRNIRQKILDIAQVSNLEYTSIPLQGSGTYAVEAVFQSTVPRSDGKVLILENGAYGKRIAKICEVAGISKRVLSFPESSAVNVNVVEDVLKDDPSFTHVAIVHCETSSGVFNPIVDVGQIVKKYLQNCIYFVDAMSSFGAVPLDFAAGDIDFMVSSANKCLQGVPGFSYVVAKTRKLLECRGYSRCLTLDLYDQYQNLEATGQFRFTPPTHTMLAFQQAIVEYEKEGGLKGRSARYMENRSILGKGMKTLGFKELLTDPNQANYIITSFFFPSDPHFDFNTFYSKLNDLDFVIYPGKVLEANCFRIGTIGEVYPSDVKELLKAIKTVCLEMNITLPLDD